MSKALNPKEKLELLNRYLNIKATGFPGFASIATLMMISMG